MLRMLRTLHRPGKLCGHGGASANPGAPPTADVRLLLRH